VRRTPTPRDMDSLCCRLSPLLVVLVLACLVPVSASANTMSPTYTLGPGGAIASLNGYGVTGFVWSPRTNPATMVITCGQPLLCKDTLGVTRRDWETRHQCRLIAMK
jgi:hypothetical protein